MFASSARTRASPKQQTWCVNWGVGVGCSSDESSHTILMLSHASLAHTQEKISRSKKCGCGWHVCLKSEGGMFVITKADLEHTGGCSPSALAYEVETRANSVVLPMYLARCIMAVFRAEEYNAGKMRRLLLSWNIEPPSSGGWLWRNGEEWVHCDRLSLRPHP